ncbi:hypothetical protein AbraIFM66950_007156 [Aspergillus brasiliensis]|nr:hypothetical protein AbraIFM66950_007156 [Aspergillus brasiliensis]
MTIPYPLIGFESYGLGSKSARRNRSTPSTPGSVDSNVVDAAFAKEIQSQEHLDSCASSSKSEKKWKAKFSRKFSFLHFA